MLKTIYKFLLCLSICLAMPQAKAASTSKVRLAASLGAQAIKATALAAKAHPFRTTMLASAIGLAGYTYYHHGKYDRQIARLEKSQEQRLAYKKNTIKDCLSDKTFACPKKIVDLIKEYEGPSKGEVLSNGLISRKKAIARRANNITFPGYLRSFGPDIKEEPFPYILVAGGVGLLQFDMPLVSVLVRHSCIHQFNRCQDLGVPCVIDYKVYKTLEEVIQYALEQQKIVLNIGKWITGATVVFGASAHVPLAQGP